MKNPLRKRLPRELKSEIGKYFVIFLLLTGTIGFVSGFLVADGSMLTAYQESFEKYQIENGNFRLAREANKAQKKTIQEQGVTLYDNFYIEERLTNDSTLRIFQNREEVNRVCLMEGRMPETPSEIAIDRMYADNNQLQVGDVLSSAAHSWTVTGLVALSDYSSLFSSNKDSMFDSVKFGVAIVTAEAFAEFDRDWLIYSYSWKYEDPPETEAEEKEQSEALMKVIVSEAEVEDFVPRYLNQAIQFTGDDMGSDRAMMITLLYIIIGIMAFVFGITTSSTISREANVIGTLRASGYTKGELVRHYMSMPMLVTLIGGVVGNLLGYTVFKDLCVGMYYGSYSLPTYVTLWNTEAFWMTTVVPAVLMFLINGLFLEWKLRLSPLQFLRRDISGRKQKHALRLPGWLSFFGRFRLRVIFQNLANYGMLLVGILFANLLLMFGLLLPAVLDHYQEEIGKNLLCNYQYILQVPYSAEREDHKLEMLFDMLLFSRAVETDNGDAEEFSAYSLNTLDGEFKSEEVLLYGVKEDSSYLPIAFEGTGVYLSKAYADKFEIGAGDMVTLKEPYEDTQYTFEIQGIYDYEGALALFMEQEELNRIFDLGEGSFGGYFSDTEITDIDEQYIGSVIDLESLTKISRQLNVSMGGMMGLVDGFAVLMFMVLIYLLSKIIIEKNAQAISMVKILGYTDGEIGRLYILATSFMVVLFVFLSLPIEGKIMRLVFRKVILTSISGWIPYYVDPMVYVKMVALGIGTYAVVAALEFRKIQKVPKGEALKNAE